jgi:hypothetical protein
VINRHLLPNEIDLIVDGEVGFGVAPLRAHVRQCAECRARVDEALTVVNALEELPHLAPSSLFADRVMSDVQVFQPWHVAARDTVARFVPRSLPARIAVGGLGVVAASILAFVSVFVGSRLGMLTLFSGTVFQRGRAVVTAVAEGLVAAAFGPIALEVFRAMGTLGLVISTFILGLGAAAAIYGVRRLATASSRRAGGI